MHQVLDLSGISVLQVLIVVSLRLVGFVLIVAAGFRAAAEYRTAKTVPTTRLLLLLLLFVLSLGSLISIIQGVCYLLPTCFDVTQVLPGSYFSAIDNAIVGIILVLIYYTREKVIH